MFRRILCIVFFTLAAMNLLLIFSFSSQDAETSGSLSARITDVLLYGHETPPEDRSERPEYQRIHHLIRKAAHFSEYASLGFLLTGGMACLKTSWPHRWAAAALISLTAAICDELFQTRVPGRAGSPWDTALDFSGALTGLILATVLAAAYAYLRRRRIQ